MIISKPNYIQLKRETKDGKRHYLTPEGHRVPSVTTILDATKPQRDRDALKNWKKRVGHAKAKEISTEAAGVGTLMHKKLEMFCEGTLKEPGSNHIQKIAHDMAHVIINSGLTNLQETWGNEISLYFPELYAGTTDFVGVWKTLPTIIDFKQSNKLKKAEWITDYYLQLCAYAAAHNEMFGTDIKQCAILMCTRNLEYQEFVLEGSDFEDYTNKWWDRVEQFYQL